MIRNIFIGIGSAFLFGVISYCAFLLGSFASELTGLKWLGILLSIPGLLFVALAFPLTFIIDLLPMYLIFPSGGAPGVFGSLLVFAFIIWSILFTVLASMNKWPFSSILNHSKKKAEGLSVDRL